jgi:hypothetical protein
MIMNTTALAGHTHCRTPRVRAAPIIRDGVRELNPQVQKLIIDGCKNWT